MASLGPRPRRLAALLILTGGVAVAACGGGGDDSTPVATETPESTSTAAPTETVAGATTTGPTATTAADTTYTVVAGDTLNAIAERFGTTVEAIAEANDIPDPNVIEIGQILVIPN